MSDLFVRYKPDDTGSCATRLAIAIGVAVAGILVLALVVIPAMTITNIAPIIGGVECRDGMEQSEVSSYAEDSIPADYLELYQEAGEDRGVPWNILAGIGQVESHHGRWDGPGIREGHNDWGAAGPMQFGSLDGSAAGNSWGGEPVMDVEDRPDEGYGVDGNGDGVVDVYDPADAIPAAADYLLAHGLEDDIRQAIFGYNHAWWYVDEVLEWADRYAEGEFTTDSAADRAAVCAITDGADAPGEAPDELTQAVVDWAMAQQGKPYIWGGVGPDGFDCSGLTMKAYESIGVTIPRIARDQWHFGPEVPAGEEQPGDLVFFDTLHQDQTPGPGHMGMVIGNGQMIEAECTLCGPIDTRAYEGISGLPILGFTRPLEHPEVQAQLVERGTSV